MYDFLDLASQFQEDHPFITHNGPSADEVVSQAHEPGDFSGIGPIALQEDLSNLAINLGRHHYPNDCRTGAFSLRVTVIHG